MVTWGWALEEEVGCASIRTKPESGSYMRPPGCEWEDTEGPRPETQMDPSAMLSIEPLCPAVGAGNGFPAGE